MLTMTQPNDRALLASTYADPRRHKRPRKTAPVGDWAHQRATLMVRGYRHLGRHGVILRDEIAKALRKAAAEGAPDASA